MLLDVMVVYNDWPCSCLVNAVVILNLQGTDSYVLFMVCRYLPRLGAKLKASGAAYSEAIWSGLKQDKTLL